MIFQKNKILAEISTFGIGGPARFFLEVSEVETLKLALQMSKRLNTPYIVIGKGSNCLFSSQGFDGLVILNKINFFTQLSVNSFSVGAGYSFSRLGTQTAKLKLTGLEFASGIPGSVGGAVFMNAGANGQDTSETLTTVTFLDDSGEIKLFTKKDLEFSYRTSPFQKMKGVILSATFSLEPLENARQKQLEIFQYRKKTQPYGEMSAGCIFRNPVNAHASALIDSSGLKGLQIGKAKVSELHANFIVNTEKATSDDVLKLIQIIQAKVKEKTGFELHSEVRLIPYNQSNDNPK
jgi:UDP-N-acetylmuramate dehydrogenase